MAWCSSCSLFMHAAMQDNCDDRVKCWNILSYIGMFSRRIYICLCPEDGGSRSLRNVCSLLVNGLHSVMKQQVLSACWITLNNTISLVINYFNYRDLCRSQWPRGLRRGFAAARQLRSWVRIPPRAWMFVCCECCVLSGRGLCDELITRPEESYRLWCVVLCDLETSRMRRPWPALGRSAT